MSHQSPLTATAAMTEVLALVEIRLQEPVDPVFLSNNKTQSVTCTEECIYASAQRLHRAVLSTLDHIRTLDSYQLEKAALKLEAFSSAYEDLALRYAEVAQLYPEAQEHLQALWPATNTIHSAGATMWETLKTNSANT